MPLSCPDSASFHTADSAFVALVDGAFQDAAARSGAHLLCRPGCMQCCVGVFAISPADSLRLQWGLKSLALTDPERADRIRVRADASWERLRSAYPGEAGSGRLDLNRGAEFAEFGNDEPCPVLDPISGTCDLYEARPHTCRVFGPPVKTEDGFGVCELCFVHATEEEVAAGAIAEQPPSSAERLDEAAVNEGAAHGETIVAFALRVRRPSQSAFPK